MIKKIIIIRPLKNDQNLMREASFIKQNAEKWKGYETLKTTDPDEIAERFITITDDLAYAKTFYPQSKTIGYLNKIATGFHQSIYKNKKESRNTFLGFWKHDLPLLFKKHINQILYSFLFFAAFALIGALSAKYDKDFVRLILGDGYVNMTNENIAKGDPFGVYKHEEGFPMFVAIAANNLYITVVCYLLGIFGAVGTILSLFKNGVMLGAFEYFFFSKGFGLKSILVIFIHGTLEISCIIIAGGAGLVFGKSILFPRTYSRLISFKRGALEGMKITLGILPIIVVAATFESFVTRHTEMPVWLSIFILTSSLFFIIWYVILYPTSVSKTITFTKTLNATKN